MTTWANNSKQNLKPLSIGRMRLDRWSLGTMIIAALIAIPLLTVFFLALSPSDDIWKHLSTTVLPDYIFTTIGLMAGVGVGTFIIGVGTAWLATMCRFPGRQIFQWALLLPLAVPAYVIAYVYTDILEFAGPVQQALRDIFGWKLARDYWFPEIRSLGGAITMMTLVLYPYVYLLSRAAFLEQSVCCLEVSRTLGRGPWKSFTTVALPLARPAIVIGLTLALMETLNDFGTVDFFAVSTFTAGIYDVWFNMNNRAGASQLAVVLLTFVIILIAAERWARRGQQYHHTSTKYRALPSYQLRGTRAGLAFFACLIPIAFGFLLPVGILANYALDYYERAFSTNFLLYAWHSLTLSGLCAVIAVMVGLFMAYSVRLGGQKIVRIATRFASIGYAVPGAVLAIGTIISLAAFDHALNDFMKTTFNITTGLLLSGTIIAVVFGYLVRFLALSFGTMEAGLTKVTTSMDGASRTLGKSPGATLRRVHLPMIKASILTAAILVFVDCMKELPMTILLRPFNYETLATYVHQFASDGLLEECALGAVTIVAAGILPVILLSRTIDFARPGSAAEKEQHDGQDLSPQLPKASA
ncbi:MAG: iron ABC transporter permease [Rhodospirillaceae bacterium]|jgi:iron(III) transport system permease protein